MSDETLQDRVEEVFDWARSRIRQCRREELKFGRVLDSGARQVCVEAATERRALQVVLRILRPDYNELLDDETNPVKP